MSITVEFKDIDGGPNPSVIVPYQYGDYHIIAIHITCGAQATRYGESYIRVLEKDRETKSGQLSLNVAK